jgi:hypothetical protein
MSLQKVNIVAGIAVLPISMSVLANFAICKPITFHGGRLTGIAFIMCNCREIYILFIVLACGTSHVTAGKAAPNKNNCRGRFYECKQETEIFPNRSGTRYLPAPVKSSSGGAPPGSNLGSG